MSKRIIVTGTAGVLGNAVAARLAEQGHAVLGIDLAPTMHDAGQSAFLGGVDLADPAKVEQAVATLAKDGPIDGLVNVAGGFRWETLDGGSSETWDLLYRMNVATAVACCRAALPHLRANKGAIVNVAAAAALKAGAGMGAYTASKAGVMRLTESLAEEEKDNAVRVNAVMPSIIDTPTNRADMPDADASRWVTPAALADVIAFLLSGGASAVTGACIPVTGRV